VDFGELIGADVLGFGLLKLILILVAGVVAGAINTIAGGGSLLTLPALIFLGLPATVANGTNRVGVLVGSVTAVAGFHSEDVLDWRRAGTLMVPTCLGAIVGAWLSTDLSDRHFQIVIGVAMLVAVTAVLLSPKKWLAQKEPDKAAPRQRWIEVVTFITIGFYGGFVQAGVGIFLLSGLVLVSNQDLVRANAIKMLLVLSYTILALIIFIWHDLVAWVPAIALAAGNAGGGWLGSKLTASWGPPLVKWVLVAVVIVSVSRLFGLW